MKDIVHSSENQSDALVSPVVKTLQKKAAAAEKSVQKAWAEYETKSAAYHEAMKNPADKIAVLELKIAAKTAKLTHKIKRMEHKLAKAQWKAAAKADQAPSKNAKSAAPKKSEQKAQKDGATKEKSGVSSDSKSDKKKVQSAKA